MEQPPPSWRSPLLFECDGCSDHFNQHQCYWLRACDHCYCAGCLSKLFEDSMKDRIDYPPSCCEVIEIEEVEHCMDPDLVNRFHAFSSAIGDQGRTDCYNCTRYIARTPDQTSEAVCTSCGARTCRLCKRAFHDGDCAVDAEAEAAEEATVGLATNNGWKRCPNCRETIEKTDGCPHMRQVLYDC